MSTFSVSDDLNWNVEPRPLFYSSAAQVVVDAFENASDGEYVEGVWVVNERTMLAAALRAAADQVVPEADTNRSPCREGCVIGAAPERIRRDLLAIAAELEAQS